MAASVAGMAEGTLLTHINRVPQRHPALYEKIRGVRASQLAERHTRAIQNARDHSRAHFRRQNRYLWRLLGFSPWV